jgi:hypothetical protein
VSIHLWQARSLSPLARPPSGSWDRARRRAPRYTPSSLPLSIPTKYGSHCARSIRGSPRHAHPLGSCSACASRSWPTLAPSPRSPEPMLRRHRWKRSLDLLRPDQVAEPQTTANRSLGRTTASNAQSYSPLLPVIVYYSALLDLDGRPCLLVTSYEPRANTFQSPLRSVIPWSNGVCGAAINCRWDILATGYWAGQPPTGGDLQFASILKYLGQLQALSAIPSACFCLTLCARRRWLSIWLGNMPCPER